MVKYSIRDVRSPRCRPTAATRLETTGNRVDQGRQLGRGAGGGRDVGDQERQPRGDGGRAEEKHRLHVHGPGAGQRRAGTDPGADGDEQKKRGEIPGIDGVEGADERAADGDARHPATFRGASWFERSQREVPGQPDGDDGKGQGHQVGVKIAKQETEERKLVDRLGGRKRAAIVDAEAVTDDAAGAPADASDTVPPPRRDGARRVLNQPPGGVEIPGDRDREEGEQAAGRREARPSQGRTAFQATPNAATAVVLKMVASARLKPISGATPARRPMAPWRR